jgi:RNA polymerase sigma factor (TIGR02999 family)
MARAVEITRLIRAWQNGDRSAQDQLFAELYTTLHRIARSAVRSKNKGDSMGPTGLVAEAYIRLQQSESLDITNRDHFLAIAARTMRRIIVDRAQAIRAQKRGGERVQVELQDSMVRLEREPEEIIAIDEALERLALTKPRAAQVVELVMFVEWTQEQVAAILNVSTRTVKRDLRDAARELKHLMGEDGSSAATA